MKRENNAKFTIRRKIKNILFLFVYRIDKYYFLFINWQQRFNILKIFINLNLKWYFIILKKKKTFNIQIQKFWICNKMFSKLLPIMYKIYDTFQNKIFLSVKTVYDVNTVFSKYNILRNISKFHFFYSKISIITINHFLNILVLLSNI